VANDQTNSATELLVTLGGKNGAVNVRLADAVRTRIGEGVLQPGDRLPPSRVLADQLGVSRWVVTEAYEQLKAEGYLTAKGGSGTTVALRAGRPRSPATAPRPLDEPTTAVDLSPANPDLAAFPRADWRRAIQHALATATPRQLSYPDAQGDPVLRRMLAAYLHRARGLAVDATDVHLTAGTRSAVSMLCQLLQARGARRIGLEDPGWPRARQIAELTGLEVMPLPVDGEGFDPDALTSAGIDAVLVSATHQFPTGTLMSPDRRHRLLAWAADERHVVIEDDYDAEFRYDRRPVGALAALDPQRVVYLGSTSKTLAPALRLGWMVVPRRLIDAVEAARVATGVLVPAVDQLALAHLVGSGSYDRHLRKMRKVYAARRAALLAALNAVMPGEPVPGMAAGLHLVWRLPDETDEDTVLAACRHAGTIPAGLGTCRIRPGWPGLLIGYGNVPERLAASVASTLAEAARSA
jgi:GntR family transcriptional regulator/MocR family aminotransferase